MRLPEPPPLTSAIGDFRRARSRAFLKEILARVTGQSTELLSYEAVRKMLLPLGSAERGLQDIPLDAIVGSVGRYTDFTRDFLPRQDSDQLRWSLVKLAASDLVGLPPIDVYRIGEAYFVKDGNHRVSVARELGAAYIQGYVTEVITRVPLSAGVQPDDLIVMAEYARFLEKTHLDELRPGADLRVSIPGQYAVLEEHISLHRLYMEDELGQAVDEADSIVHWYDNVYLPAVQSMRELGVLRNYPERTETDLYLWITQHRDALEKELGWTIKTEKAALDLLNRKKPVERQGGLGDRLLGALTLGALSDGPAPGAWRRERIDLLRENRLFADLLVPVDGQASGWFALEQALVLAGREDARLNGLHVTEAEALKDSPEAQQVQAEFHARCAARGVPGKLAVTSGEISRQISNQARLNDLVITTLLHPPQEGALARLDSGFRDLIQRCPRPVLAVPQVVSPMQRALLAYDGSPKGEEALFVATYLAGRWDIPLTVVTVLESEDVAPETLKRARAYLEAHAVDARYIAGSGPIGGSILQAAADCGADFVIMGGYGHRPVLEVVLGSAVDQVLRQARLPVLICR